MKKIFLDEIKEIEYYGENYDVDFFENKHIFKKIYMLIPVLVLMIALAISYGVSVTSDNNESVTADTSEILGTNTDIAEMSKVLDRYFRVIQSNASYDELNELCINSSSFNDSYIKSMDQIETVYDVNDTLARYMKEASKVCKVNRINKVVVEDDGSYRCYVDLAIPNSEDASELVFTYAKYNSQFFKVNSVNVQNINRCLLEDMSIEPVSYSSKGYVINFVKDDEGVYKFDDSSIAQQYIASYEESITELAKSIS